MKVDVPSSWRSVVPGVLSVCGPLLIAVIAWQAGKRAMNSLTSHWLLLHLLHPFVTPPAPVLQVMQVVLPLNGVTAGRVKQMHRLPGVHPIHVDQIPADQVPGAVQAVGAVHANQLIVLLILPQEAADGAFEAQDGVITGNLVTSREDLHTQQGPGNVLEPVVTCGESEVDDQPKLLLLAADSI